MALELVAGLALGVVIPALVVLAWRLRILTIEPRLQVLGPLGIAVILYAAACHLTHANPYLAAFAAGSTVATLDRVAAERFEHFGDLLSETTKFAALLVFGALITPDRISDLSLGDWAVAVLAILLIRPAAMLLSLLRTTLPARERYVAAWFGPKGFASVVYGLLVLQGPTSGTTGQLAHRSAGSSDERGSDLARVPSHETDGERDDQESADQHNRHRQTGHRDLLADAGRKRACSW